MKKIFAFALAALTLFATSCVKDKIYSGVTFDSIDNTIPMIQTETAQVTATISALVEIKNVKLYYKGGEGEYTAVDMIPANGGYKGTIPGFAKDTEVSFYLAAETDIITNSKVITYVVGQKPIDYTGLVLNELNGNDKFIEIYNGAAEEIFIGGIKMFKDGGDEETWTAPDEYLAAGAYLLLYSEDVVAGGAAQEGYPDKYVFHSGLSSKKAVRIHITKPDGITILDDFNFTSATHPGTKYAGSFGRNADGKWYHQETITPGAANVDGTEKLPFN